MVADYNKNRVFGNEDVLNFGKLLTVGNVNVLSVVNVYPVLIGALLGVVLPFLETYDNQVVLFKLSDQGFLAL